MTSKSGSVSLRRLADSPLAAATVHLDLPAVINGDHVWTWRQIHEAAIALASRIERATALCNICTSRAGFLVACLAALRNRCLLVLPASRSDTDLDDVLSTCAAPVVVGDADAMPGTWNDRRAHAAYLRCPADRSAGTASGGDDALAWKPAWDEIAVVLHTSGSTGLPQPQPKTLRQLATGAVVLGDRLSKDLEGGLGAIRRIVCSVVQQHMFGFECSVMLPLMHGIPVLDRRPLLPADVQAAFEGSTPTAWIATPMHLRSLVASGEKLSACSVVIASTMPLARHVARQSEALVGAPVLEIYGSTETGAMAMRRTARDTPWAPISGVRLESRAGATIVRGSHFASPATLRDQVSVAEDGSFALLGRDADLIKIAGHRASLSGLDLLLQELPGMEDGAFYLPATGSLTERLCLVHSGPPLDRDAVRRWLRARIDPVFLPRVIIRVDRLPRSDGGKLKRQALDHLYAQWLAAGQPEPPAPRRHERFNVTQ